MDGVTNGFDQVNTVKAQEMSVKPVQSQAKSGNGKTSVGGLDQLFDGTKAPTKSTIDSAVSDVNAKLAQLSKTRCSYSYDDVTKQVCVKIYDEETDEVIREVPPEKSIEMLKKFWELAGIIVDEKR